MTLSNENIGHSSVSVASGDALDVRRFTVHERISALFTVSLSVVSRNPDIDFDAVVGLPARFSVRGAAHERSWSGICNRLQLVAVEERGLSTYDLEIVPTLWLATQRRNYRMFQQQSELDIVLALLGEWGIEPVKKLSGVYKKRKYRVQYAESDFAFMSRMLEDAGVSFFFEEGDRETKLVLSDVPQANARRAHPIPFRDRPTTSEREHVTAVKIGQQVRPGRYTLRDHDYRLPPDFELFASADAGKGVESRLERFHYTPGAFLFGTPKGEDTPFADDRGKTRTDMAEARILAQKRLEAQRENAWACTFETNALDLAPGVVMSVLDHPRADLAEGQELLVVEATMRGTLDGAPSLTHACEARSAAFPHRPPLQTPKPKVSGVESATVVGPAGEEIHTDEFGRVRVHFHWDRESRMDERSSCWIHVSQSWGGAGYGGTNLPRVGQEVLVDFLGDDPDRPVIVGRVYTNLQRTPYKLPENKTQSGLKSNSTGGGGGYNELMFEDAAGRELLRMQAERDLHLLVKNDEQHTVGNDRKLRVTQDEEIVIGNDQTTQVAGTQQHAVGLNQSVSVGVNRSTQIGAIDSTLVGDTHVVMVSPPGEGGGGGATSKIMTFGKIVLDTALGATITMEGDTITFAAAQMFFDAGTLLSASSGGEAQITSGAALTLGSAAEASLTAQTALTVVGTGQASLSSEGPLSIAGAKVTTAAPEIALVADATLQASSGATISIESDATLTLASNETTVGGDVSVEVVSEGKVVASGKAEVAVVSDQKASLTCNEGAVTINGNTVSASSMGDLTLRAVGGDLKINGGPMVKINNP